MNGCNPKNHADIAYGFMIGGDDFIVLEGRGYDYQGEWEAGKRVAFYNQLMINSLMIISYVGVMEEKSLIIAFIDDFGEIRPRLTTFKRMLIESTKRFLDDSVALGKLTENFTISTTSLPGQFLYKALRDFPQFQGHYNRD